MSTLQERLQMLAGNLGKLSVSILEYYVEKVIGEDAVEIIGDPYKRDERVKQLVWALSQTEESFKHIWQKKDPKDLDIYYALHDLPLHDLPSVIDATKKFETDINFDKLRQALIKNLEQVPPLKSKNTLIQEATKEYVEILQKNVVLLPENTEYREKLQTTKIIDILAAAEVTNKLLASILATLSASSSGEPPHTNDFTDTQGNKPCPDDIRELVQNFWACKTIQDAMKFRNIITRSGLGAQIDTLGAYQQLYQLVEAACKFGKLDTLVGILSEPGHEADNFGNFTLELKRLINFIKDLKLD